MNLSDREKSILKRVVTDDTFELFKEIHIAMIENWSKQPLDGETSFQVAREALKRKERDEGIKLFINELERLCQ